MRHFNYVDDKLFVKKPMEYTRYTDKEFLQYSLGATLYMPSSKDIVNKIINKEIEGLTTMVMCFEDAIREEDLSEAEDNVLSIVKSLNSAIINGIISQNDIPLYFLRVRNLKQFKDFTSRLKREDFNIITGFIFPKFTSSMAEFYLKHLVALNEMYPDVKIYGMPIIEEKVSLYKETRIEELRNIASILDREDYNNFILNIRVGATDFSSIFGLRRGIDNIIYDIRVISDCLCDVMNYFGREERGFVLSAPVWEYFSNQRVLKPELRETPFKLYDLLAERKGIINKAIDGLIREVLMDKANGFIGKTIIHPSHIKYVNALQCITEEEFNDAEMILKNQGGGVFKGADGNKMNETNPHLYWAKKIIALANVYGVIKKDEYINLF